MFVTVRTDTPCMADGADGTSQRIIEEQANEPFGDEWLDGGCDVKDRLSARPVASSGYDRWHR